MRLSETASQTPDLTVSETSREVTEIPVRRTRSGRVSKPPVRYEPVEQVEDDYAEDEYDEIESDVGSEIEFSESEEDDEADSEMDDFIVEDKSESDDDDTNGERVKPGPTPTKRPTVGPVRKSSTAK